MKHCVLMVLSNPVPGREAEYNQWYTNQHLSDVLQVPGFKTAQRFSLVTADTDANSDHHTDTTSGWKYLAIYEFEAEDPQVSMAALMARAGSPDMVLSEAMDMGDYSAVPWLAITDKVTR